MAGIRSEEIGFIGLDDFKKRLQEIYGKLSGAIMRDALYAAARVYREEIEARTPVGKPVYVYEYPTKHGKRTVRIRNKYVGRAKANVIIYQRRRRGELATGADQLSLLVGHSKKQAFYAFFPGARHEPNGGATIHAGGI